MQSKKRRISFVLISSTVVFALSCLNPNSPAQSTTGPVTPTGVTATAGDGHILMAWAAVAGAISYNVYYTTGTTVNKLGSRMNTSASPYDLTNLINGTQYALAVTAVNSNGESDLSVIQVVLPTAAGISQAPTGLIAVSGSDCVTLAWNTVPGALSYNLYYKADSVVAMTDTKVAGVTSPYTICPLISGTNYAFVVSDLNSFGESGPSSTVRAIPLPGANMRSITIQGTVTAPSTGIGSMIASVSGDGIVGSQLFPLSFDKSVNQFSGIITVPPTGILWTVTIISKDTLGHKVGMTSKPLDNIASSLTFSASGTNALPVPNAAGDTTVSLNDTVKLRAAPTDSFGGTIVKTEWRIGDNGVFTSASTDTFIVTPSTGGNIVCTFRVTDDDGNISTDAVYIAVLAMPPTVNAGPDTIVMINAPVHLHGVGTDETAIVRYEWKFGSSAWFIASSGDTNIAAPSSELTYACSLKVTDNDGNISVDGMRVTTYDSIIIDIDGNRYRTLKIGTQVWTAQNLRTKTYNNGLAIPSVTDSTSWKSLVTPAYCFYNNTINSDSIEKFGALYNWYAVDTKNLAPAGWHVPSDAEWRILQNYLIANGYNWDGINTGNGIAKALAAKTDWKILTSAVMVGMVGYDLSLNNKSGFSAMPGGQCNYYSGTFSNIGGFSYWWCTSDVYYISSSDRSLLKTSGFGKSSGFSVRLVRD